MISTEIVEAIAFSRVSMLDVTSRVAKETSKIIVKLFNSSWSIKLNEGVIYTGNPQILKKVCPGVFGTIKPVGYCMIGQKWKKLLSKILLQSYMP